MTLLQALPDDETRALVAFLDARDLTHAASLSRAAAHDSCFQRIRDAQAATLVLPSTNDDNRCGRLLHGIHRRNPQRLASFQSIQVITPWQVDTLLEDAAIAKCVESALVRATDRLDPAIVTEICEKLRGLPRLHVLDASSTPLANVDAVARMTQLRELDLSRTNITDVAALAAFRELRVLVLEETIVTNLECVQDMTHLQVLRVSLDANREAPGGAFVVIPPLHRLSRLRTLVLQKCSVQSSADLIHVAPSLQQLELTDVHARDRALVEEDELLARLVQLETILLDDKQDVLTPASSTLAKIPSLRVIKHVVDKDLQSLATLVHLEEIYLSVPRSGTSDVVLRDSEDYTFLLRLPRLKKVKIELSPRQWCSHAAALAHVLPRLPKLTSLDYSGYIPNDAFLAGLKHLEHLTLGKCAPDIRSFEWIRGYRSLRSLELTISAMRCDLSAIGALSTLEALRVSDASFIWKRDHPGRYHFLTHLGNLKSFQMNGYVEDLALLDGMAKLETLIVWTSRASSDALDSLVSLRYAHTAWRDVYSLPAEAYLRETTISDGRPLDAGDERPRLLRVLRPHREALRRREWDRQHGAHDNDDDDIGGVYGDMTGDY